MHTDTKEVLFETWTCGILKLLAVYGGNRIVLCSVITTTKKSSKQTHIE